MTEGAGNARGVALRFVALVVLIAVTVYFMDGIRDLDESPLGCDAFGYERQAQLFRDHGWGGFDTRLETPSSRKLIEIAKATGVNAPEWYQGIAPHCHHYRVQTDKVILQYPPGTGIVMALFPMEVQARWVRVASLFVAAAALALMLARIRHLGQGALVIGATVLTLISLRQVNGTESAWIGTALAVICGLLLAPALQKNSMAWLALLGLIAGFSTTVRVTNVVIVGVVGLVLLYRLARGRKPTDVLALVTFSVAALVGLLPMLIAGAVNAGSIFRSTYSEIDASLPDLNSIARSAAVYFSPTSHGLILMASLAIGAVTLCLRWRSTPVWVAVAVMVLTLAYLVPKPVAAWYYLMPASVFLIAASLSALLPERAGAGRWRAAGFAAAVLVAGITATALTAFPDRRLPVDETMRDELAGDPIIWADVYGGPIIAGYGVYTAKLNFASAPEMQDRLVADVDAAGLRQLFVADTKTMVGIIDRLREQWRLDQIGTLYGFPVYELEGRRAP